MAIYVINHKVNDINAWKKIYDEFEATRQQFAVKEHYALQSVENINHVLVVGEGELEAIHKFLNSEDLKTGMAGAGIASPPEHLLAKIKFN
ncbi:MAG: hypothetical protein V7782_15835 [Psychromonas sp.]